MVVLVTSLVGMEDVDMRNYHKNGIWYW
jgi:hypothetical protein